MRYALGGVLNTAFIHVWEGNGTVVSATQGRTGRGLGGYTANWWVSRQGKNLHVLDMIGAASIPIYGQDWKTAWYNTDRMVDQVRDFVVATSDGDGLPALDPPPYAKNDIPRLMATAHIHSSPDSFKNWTEVELSAAVYNLVLGSGHMQWADLVSRIRNIPVRTAHDHIYKARKLGLCN